MAAATVPQLQPLCPKASVSRPASSTRPTIAGTTMFMRELLPSGRTTGTIVVGGTTGV